MIPIDFQDLRKEEVDKLTRWFADPAYQLLREVLEARCVRHAISAVESLADGEKAEAGEDSVEARQADELLKVLEAVAVGHFGEGTGARQFEYQRVIAVK